MKRIRIGCGAGYGGDRIEPAISLLKEAALDYIGFECLAERTIALAQKIKHDNPDLGYNELLEYRMSKILPIAYEKKVKVITNMGAANPYKAGEITLQLAKNLNIKKLKVATIEGDDVLHLLENFQDEIIIETGLPLSTIYSSVISANAYLGCKGIVEALKNDADIIITGRVADPALFLAPMIFEFGWSYENYNKLGKGTLVGHLLECAGQLTGGYFADPGKKDVPQLWDLGFPYAVVDENGEGYVTKLKGSGGILDKATCTEQLLYEIHDPANYITPDCVADFSKVTFNTIETNTVAFGNASGRKPTDSYKVSVGFKNGYLGEGEISYGGNNCLNRSKLAGKIIRKRLEKYNFNEIKIDYIGSNSISPINKTSRNPPEIRLRVAGKTSEIENAMQVGREVEALYTNGPAGGGGATKLTKEMVSVVSILLPKNIINHRIVYLNI